MPPVLLSFALTLLIWTAITVGLYILLTYVFRWITRRLPGEVDDLILGIMRRPLLVLAVAYGIVQSLFVLPLPAADLAWLGHAFNTFAISTVAYLLWRVLKDVVLYYGERWVQQTESRLDDVLLPIVNLFGPLTVVIGAILLILPEWGIDVNSVLVGAGVLGLVLGLALQETLTNIFGGLNLLADAPFRTGDLIVLADGKLCQVEHIGLRATQLYNVDEHCTVYVPNKDLANSLLVNVTKPTVDLKVAIAVGVSYEANLEHVTRVLTEVAEAHPNVLTSDLPRKQPLLSARRDALIARGGTPASGQETLPASAQRVQIALDRLRHEHALHTEIVALETALRALATALSQHELDGFTLGEVAEITARHLLPLDTQLQRVTTGLQAWAALDDPWAQNDELASERNRWASQNHWLTTKWASLRKLVAQPRQENERRLDTLTLTLADWVRREYKVIPEIWKDPRVTFKAFSASSVDVELDFYIDNIRLEHFERRQRVVTEIAHEIQMRFRTEGLEMPFPQLDVSLRKSQ